MPIKVTETTFTLSLEEVQKILTEKLIEDKLIDKDSSCNIRYILEEVGGDPMDRYPGSKEVTKVTITSKTTSKLK